MRHVLINSIQNHLTTICSSIHLLAGSDSQDETVQYMRDLACEEIDWSGVTTRRDFRLFSPLHIEESKLLPNIEKELFEQDKDWVQIHAEIFKALKSVTKFIESPQTSNPFAGKNLTNGVASSPHKVENHSDPREGSEKVIQSVYDRLSSLQVKKGSVPLSEAINGPMPSLLTEYQLAPQHVPLLTAHLNIVITTTKLLNTFTEGSSSFEQHDLTPLLNNPISKLIADLTDGLKKRITSVTHLFDLQPALQGLSLALVTIQHCGSILSLALEVMKPILAGWKKKSKKLKNSTLPMEEIIKSFKSIVQILCHPLEQTFPELIGLFDKSSEEMVINATNHLTSLADRVQQLDLNKESTESKGNAMDPVTDSITKSYALSCRSLEIDCKRRAAMIASLAKNL